MALTKHLVILGCSLLLIGICYLAVHFYEGNKNNFRRDLTQIQQFDILRVTVEKDNHSLNDAQSVVDLQKEMIKRFAAANNIHRIAFKEANNLEQGIDSLLFGSTDILAWTIPVYGELAERITYSAPVLTSRQVLVQRSEGIDSTTKFIRNQLDLAQKTVYIQAGSPARGRIENLAKEIGDTIYVREIPNAQPTDLIQMILTGDIHYAVCDEFAAGNLALANDSIDAGTAVSFAQNYSWALNPAAYELKKALDSWIAEFTNSNEYKELYNKYLAQ